MEFLQRLLVEYLLLLQLLFQPFVLPLHLLQVRLVDLLPGAGQGQRRAKFVRHDPRPQGSFPLAKHALAKPAPPRVRGAAPQTQYVVQFLFFLIIIIIKMEDDGKKKKKKKKMIIISKVCWQ